MRKSILRASAAMQTIALLGVGATAFIAAAPAAAQDYTSGALVGSVHSTSGAPVAGATVTLRSIAQGQVRNLVTGSTGTFNAAGLAPGDYAINIAAGGYNTHAGTISIVASQTNSVDVGLETAASGNAIVVTGSRLRQSVTQGTTGANINVVKVNEQLPIGHDITDITLLAPTTLRGVSGFATAAGDSVPSVGGGSVAENAYYVNGLNITNPDTYVGGSRVPFYLYQNVDVQTGGYPAEFGRATGGVINATTKSGSNIPFVALHLDWEPNFLRSHSPNRGNPDSPTDIGRLRSIENRSATLEAGGAVVPDHLFVYGLLQANRNTDKAAYPNAGQYEIQKDNDPFYAFKIDGYITPTQHAEFTYFDTRSKINIFDYDFEANDAYTDGTIGTKGLAAVQEAGGVNWIARYTGNITDWLTASAAYGLSKDKGSNQPADNTSYYVIDRRTVTTGGNAKAVGQPFATQDILNTRRRFYRGDMDARFTFGGTHHVRFGFDHEDLSETKIATLVGTQPYIIDYRNSGIRITYEVLGGAISATDTSYYIQDSWTDLVDGLTLNFGIRNDRFTQSNLSGERYADLKNNWGPRVGFSYTPPSAEQFRFFGSFGRYFIPPAMTLGFRGRDVYFREYFNYPAGTTADTFQYDPTTGLPQGNFGPPVLNIPGYGTPCPNVPGLPTGAGAPGNNAGVPACVVYGAGVQEPAISKLAIGAKATYEDEFILGGRYHPVGSRWDFGLTATHRVLKRVSEDTDFAPQLADKFCPDATYDETDPDNPIPTNLAGKQCDFYSSNGAYYIWNPGTESVQLLDFYSAISGNVVPVTLTGLTFSKPRRTYTAVVFDFSRADDGLWFGAGSVTWSKSIGSTEGTVKSDAGNGAQDGSGATQDFDYTGLDDYNYGLLPNDRRWTFKLYGALHATRALTLGANVFVQSGGHGSCQSIHPTNDFAAGYGASSFYCPTGVLTAKGNYPYASIVPGGRGIGPRGDWIKQLDLSARYNIPLGRSDNQRLTLRADVFNVFNSHAVRQRYVESVTGQCTTTTPTCDVGDYIPNPTYNTPLSYQPPRHVRLGLDLMWGGSPALPPVVEAVLPPPPPPPAMQTCPDGSMIAADAMCPVPPPPPPPPAPVERGERGQ